MLNTSKILKQKQKKEEKKFWKDQKEYEKDLKRRDREAYEAYMQGKTDAQEEHYSHCSDHCHHSHFIIAMRDTIIMGTTNTTTDNQDEVLLAPMYV